MYAGKRKKNVFMIFYRGRSSLFLLFFTFLVGFLFWTLYFPVSPLLAEDITIEETELLGGEEIYGLDVSDADSPYINRDSYFIQTDGDDSGDYDDVTFSVYGIFSSNQVVIENHGDISVNTLGGTAEGTDANASVTAYGIISEGNVTNSGAVTVRANGGKASGNYTTATANALAYGVISGDNVTNLGDLTVSADGGRATGNYTEAYTTAEAYGIMSGDKVTNYGDIAVSATGGRVSGNYTDATTNAEAYGIYNSGNATNYRNITVRATGGTVSGNYTDVTTTAEAFGIYTSDNATNDGDITVTATGGRVSGNYTNAYTAAEAYGIYSEGDNVTNNGTITVRATGGTAEVGDYANANATAYGIISRGNVSNNGTITVSAAGGMSLGNSDEASAQARGIYVSSSDATVINSGNIIVSASAREGYEVNATGIYFENGGSLTNTGVIRAIADTWAYDVIVASGTVTLEDTYSVNLDGSPEVGSLYVAADGELAINDALLRLTSVGGETWFNTDYRFFQVEEGGTVSGSFRGIGEILNPSVVIEYSDQGTADSSDDIVSLSYEPEASPQLNSIGSLRNVVAFSADSVGQRLTNSFLENRLASSKPRLYAAAQNVASDAPHYGAPPPAPDDGIFLTPYYTSIEDKTDPAGYDADLNGFVAGAEHWTGSRLSGVHFGYGHSELEFNGEGYSSDREDQQLLSGGFHLMGSRGNWTGRGQVTGFYAWHDYTGLTGLNLEQGEKADYDSYGVLSSLIGGYLLPFGDQMLLPEGGLEHLWIHRDSYTTDAGNYAGWEVHNSSLDEHQVSALASLRWLIRKRFGDVRVSPSLAVGIRYLLTDDEISIKQTVPRSTPVTVSTEQDELVGTGSAGLKVSRDQLSAEVAYDGEVSDDSNVHSIWLRFRYLF